MRQNKKFHIMNRSFLFVILFSCSSIASTNLPLVERLHDASNGVMVVAHRGCWEDAPENSLKAIEDCLTLGVDIVEVDVRRSMDGVLVLMHDKSINRTTNGEGLIADLTYAQLVKVKLRDRAGGIENDITIHDIPAFREVLDLAKGKILVNVDAKEDVFMDVMSLAQSLGMEEQIILKLEVRADDPELEENKFLSRTHFMPKVTEGTVKLSTFVEEYESFGPVAIEVKAQSEQYISEGISELAKMDVRLWINTMSESPEKAAGHIDSLAINDPDKHWGKLIRLGVNMIQTDHPKELLYYLKKSGLH